MRSRCNRLGMADVPARRVLETCHSAAVTNDSRGVDNRWKHSGVDIHVNLAGGVPVQGLSAGTLEILQLGCWHFVVSRESVTVLAGASLRRTQHENLPRTAVHKARAVPKLHSIVTLIRCNHNPVWAVIQSSSGKITCAMRQDTTCFHTSDPAPPKNTADQFCESRISAANIGLVSARSACSKYESDTIASAGRHHVPHGGSARAQRGAAKLVQNRLAQQDGYSSMSSAAVVGCSMWRMPAGQHEYTQRRNLRPQQSRCLLLSDSCLACTAAC